MLDDAAARTSVRAQVRESDGPSAGTGAGLAFVAMDERDGPPAALVASASVSNHLCSPFLWYRLAIRNLFAVARATGRVAFLPRVTCACDRYWGNVLAHCAIVRRRRSALAKTDDKVQVRNLASVHTTCPTWKRDPYRGAGVSFLVKKNVARYNPAILSTSVLVLDLDVGDPNRPEARGSRGRGHLGGGREGNAISPCSRVEKGVRTENVAAAARVRRANGHVACVPERRRARARWGDANEGLLIVSSGIASFCGFEPRGGGAFVNECASRWKAGRTSTAPAPAASGARATSDSTFPEASRRTATARPCARARETRRRSGRGTKGGLGRHGTRVERFKPLS